MPVVVMIGCYAVPATIMRFEGVMRPALTRIGARHHNILPVEPERPDVRGMRVSDTRLDGCRSIRSGRRTIRWNRPRKRILNLRIPFYTRHVRPGSQCLGVLAAAIYQNCVNEVESLIFEPSLAQPLLNRALGSLALTPERIVHVDTLFVFCRQRRRSAQVSLVSEHHEKLRLLTVRGMFHHPRRNLACRRQVALSCSMRGAERPQSSYGRCNNEQ